MNPNQEKSIVRNIFTLTKKTVNVNLLVEDLTRCHVFSLEEQERILSYDDEESQCNLLYETILRKSATCFNFLTKSLRETGNSRLANLLEGSLTSGNVSKSRKHSQLTKRVSCSDFYSDVLDNKLISGKEMGIAEILEENPQLNQNPLLLVKILKVETNPGIYESFPNFVVKSTLILRDWTLLHKREANLRNLIELLNSAKLFISAARIRKMFERADIYEEKLEVDDEKNPVSIVGREKRIIGILDHNPSFCLHKERLFLMLNIPMEFYKLCTATTSQSHGLVKNGATILKLWGELYEREASVQRMTSLLIQNGHPFTAEKMRRLC